VLSTAIRKAWKENKKTVIQRVRERRGNDDIFLQVTVKPPEPRTAHGYTLLMFVETKADPVIKENSSSSSIGAEHQHEYMMEMEAELSETRTNLQMAVEEMETTNEELQSSNEELLSANEELQSGNEELQSLNEELHTLNTEHQVKIRELIELNDDLDNYFRSTDIGQIFIDSNLAIRKFNPAAVRMINLIPADIGRPINHISSNIQYDNLIGDIHSVLSDGHIIEKEIKLNTGTNNLMRIMPYTRKDRQNDGVVIAFVDITDITELNNMISAVFNASTAAILAFRETKNTSGKIIDFNCVAYNKAALEMLGKTAVELDSRPSIKEFSELANRINFEQYVRASEGGKPLQVEIQMAGDKWYQLLSAKLDDGFVISLTNITDRRNAEQKLKHNYNELIVTREGLKQLNNELEDRVIERTQKLTESEERFNLVSRATNDTIWDWNLVDNTIWRSENFTSMFGYIQNEETNSLDFWFSKVHPDDRTELHSSVHHAINQNAKNWSAEYRFQKSDGNYAFLLDRASILRDEFNTPHRLVGSIVDITRLIETEQRLTESEIKAREATEALMRKKDEFMSIASHELKTPVTSLKGALQIVARMSTKMDGNDPLVSFIDKALKQTGKLTLLLDDLLDVTKIQEGKMLLNYAPFDAVEMVKESIEEVRSQGHTHRLVFECNCDDDAMINADRLRLEQVVNNLLTNAIKYSPQADRVVISCYCTDNEFKVMIRDFGIGIPDDKKGLLFDRFYRVQESSTHFSGLGLGLYISAEIIKRHHGQIGVDSMADSGSTFWFTIPK